MNNKRPNILFIVSDQHRHDCIGYAKKYPVNTPNLDRLTEKGMSFTECYTALPTCCPARQALLSGRRPEKLGALWNYNISLKTGMLEPEVFTWPKALKEADYSTAYVGKWHVHETFSPVNYGYDYYVSEQDYKKYRDKKYPDMKLNHGILGGKDPVPLEETRTHYMAAKAGDFIKELSGREEPWHVRIDFTEPHLPCEPAFPFYEMYKPVDAVKWGSFEESFINKPYIQKQQLMNWEIEDYTWEHWAPVVARYYGAISQMDDAVGNVLKILEESGQANNTIVVYTSDHGDLCGGHRMMDKHYVLYDDTIKVPMIVSWPGITEPGSRCGSFVYNVLDMMPTILDIIGVPASEELDGRSLIPLMKGNTPLDWRTQVLCSFNGQQFGLYTSRVLRDRQWKYIWNTTDVDELYDLDSDPHELNNLIYDENSRIVLTGMRKRLYEELVAAGDEIVLMKGRDFVAPNPWIKRQLLENKKI